MLARRGGSPLLNLGLFGYRSFSLGLATLAFFFAVHNSFLLVSTVYLQSGLRVAARAAGGTFVWFGGGFLGSAYLSIRLIGRFGRRLLQLGLALMLAALAGLAGGRGGGAAGAAGLAAALRTGQQAGHPVAAQRGAARAAGAAGGVYATFQQVASALGVTLIGGLFFAYWGQHPPASYAAAYRLALAADAACLLVAAGLLQYLPPARERGGAAGVRPGE